MKPIRGGLLLAIASIAAMLAIPATSGATYPGANGRIAFNESPGEVSEPPPGGSDVEIFSVSPSGDDPIQLTDNAQNDYGPSWSANGTKLAFERFDRHDWEIWTMRADGTHQHQVTRDLATELGPHLSPNGGRIVFADTPAWVSGGGGNIATIRTDGTDRMRLLDSGAQSADPEFSPDGSLIAFSGRARRSGARKGIWVMDRNGSDLRLLADDADISESDPDTSVWNYGPDFRPDGSHIAFGRAFDDGHASDHEVVVMRTAGTHKHVVSSQRADLASPAYSPDGTRIAASTQTGLCDIDPCGSRIVSIAAQGGNARKVTQRDALGNWWSPYDGQPSWQPIPPR